MSYGRYATLYINLQIHLHINSFDRNRPSHALHHIARLGHVLGNSEVVAGGNYGSL